MINIKWGINFLKQIEQTLYCNNQTYCREFLFLSEILGCPSALAAVECHTNCSREEKGSQWREQKLGIAQEGGTGTSKNNRKCKAIIIS